MLFLDRMCPRIRALELPPPAAALRDVDPVPRSRSFLWRAIMRDEVSRYQGKNRSGVLFPLSQGKKDVRTTNTQTFHCGTSRWVVGCDAPSIQLRPSTARDTAGYGSESGLFCSLCQAIPPCETTLSAALDNTQGLRG